MVTTRNVKTADGRVALYVQTYFRSQAKAEAFAAMSGTAEVVFRPGTTHRGRFYPAASCGVWGM